MKALLVLFLAFPAFSACSTEGSEPPGPVGPDGGTVVPMPDATTNTGQRVVMCAGKVLSNAPSNCPHGDCDETSSEVVSCSAYASIVPGQTAGLCKAGATNSYALKFKKTGETNVYYEVVECNAGAAILHACAFGVTTSSAGYNGQPGYVCTN